MAELADAADSKSADPCDRGGSTPPPGTNEPSEIKALINARHRVLRCWRFVTVPNTVTNPSFSLTRR